MDYEKFVNELLDNDPLAELFRERFVNQLIEDLSRYTEYRRYESDEDRDSDRAWAAGVAEWLRDDYL